MFCTSAPCTQPLSARDTRDRVTCRKPGPDTGPPFFGHARPFPPVAASRTVLLAVPVATHLRSRSVVTLSAAALAHTHPRLGPLTSARCIHVRLGPLAAANRARAVVPLAALCRGHTLRLPCPFVAVRYACTSARLCRFVVACTNTAPSVGAPWGSVSIGRSRSFASRCCVCPPRALLRARSWCCVAPAPMFTFYPDLQRLVLCGCGFHSHANELDASGVFGRACTAFTSRRQSTGFVRVIAASAIVGSAASSIFATAQASSVVLRSPGSKGRSSGTYHTPVTGMETLRG